MNSTIIGKICLAFLICSLIAAVIAVRWAWHWDKPNRYLADEPSFREIFASLFDDKLRLFGAFVFITVIGLALATGWLGRIAGVAAIILQALPPSAG